MGIVDATDHEGLRQGVALLGLGLGWGLVGLGLGLGLAYDKVSRASRVRQG